VSGRRPKMSAWERKHMAKWRKERADKKAALIAALTTDQVDAILHAIHGRGGAGKSTKQVAEEIGCDIPTMIAVCDKYTDKVTHRVYHPSVAEAKAFRAKRRAHRKAARAPCSKLPAPAPTP
jgi:hypothetical protein